MGDLFDATLSAHFHTAYVRGGQAVHDAYTDWRRKNGQPVIPNTQVNHVPWRTYVDTIGRSGPVLSRILPQPRDAMQALTRHHDRGNDPGEDARSRHAIGAWADFVWHYRQSGLVGGPPYDGLDLDRDVIRPLKGLLTRYPRARPLPGIALTDAELLATQDPDGAQTQTLAALHPSQNVDKFQLIESTIDQKGVTRVQAQLKRSIQLSAEELPDAVKKMAILQDPRAWSQNYPELWAASYLVKNQNACVDRFANPQPSGNTSPIGQSFGPDDGLLFEYAQLALLGVPLMGGTNLLKVTYVVDDAVSPQIVLKYRLQEGLTTSMLCFTSPGGVDVDSANKNTDIAPEGQDVDANVYAIEFTSGAPGSVTIRMGKHLRFSKEVNFSEEFNAISLPMWTWGVTAGLYSSIQP